MFVNSVENLFLLSYGWEQDALLQVCWISVCD